MTLLHLWNKLRKYNKGNYRQIRYCTGFAVMLISSYMMMLFCPLVQYTLPEGGDSRKQIYMIFALALLGCSVFCIYAMGLFLRYKSREIGVFLALGADKNKIRKTLLAETAQMAVQYSAIGIAAGSVLSFLLGNVMELVAREASAYAFAFTAAGFAGSLLFAAAMTSIMMIQTARFLKRTNIMDILNEQRKQEPLKKSVSKNYLILSVIFLVTGILMAFVMPTMVTRLTQHWMGGWTNLFYLVAVIGLYRILVYSISSHKRGNHPQKYYNHVISYGILKFTGASIVRNMLVITLLLMAGIFALFYIPLNSVGTMSSYDQYENNYSFFYPQNADELTEAELLEMANAHHVSIEDYREAEFVKVLGSGVERENLDDNGNLIVNYHEKYMMYECISQSNFNSVTGQNLKVRDGTYYMIQQPNAAENIFFRFDNMDRLYLPDRENYLSMKYNGNISYLSLVLSRGFDENARYIISDSDFETLKRGADDSNIITHVLFNTADTKEAIAFSQDLYREFALRQSDNMKINSSYDSWQAQLLGSDYGYDYDAVYDPDNSVRETDWRYYPRLILLEQSNYYLSFSIYFLLFLYVAVICLAACGIIAFTRSQNVGTGNRQVFGDIEKLGADHNYLKNLLKEQIQKIFLLPTIIGCTVMFLFEALLLFMNDSRFTADDTLTMLIVCILLILVILYQYAVYRISKKKVSQMLQLQ